MYKPIFYVKQTIIVIFEVQIWNTCDSKGSIPVNTSKGACANSLLTQFSLIELKVVVETSRH